MQRTITSARIRGAGGSVRVMGVLAATLALLAGAAGAWAQIIQPVDPPQYVIVTENNTQMKAGPGDVHYTVKVLTAGQVLRVDGETDERTLPRYLRVEYPPGMSAFVKAEEGVAEGNVVRLTVPSRLRALNVSGGERGHWWFLLPEDRLLPVGTALPLVDTLMSEGRVYGYRVPAPPESRGFVRAGDVSPASPEVVERYLQMLAGEGAETKTEPAPAAPERAEVAPVEPAQQPVEEPAAVEPEVQPQPEPELKPIVTPSPVEQVEQPAPVELTPTEPRTPERTETAAARPARSGEPASLETLQSLYEQAQSQPIREAELDEVIAEFERTIESLKGPEDQRTREFLTSRLELLRLRADLQKSMRAAEQLADASGERRERFERDSAALDRARAYTVVGRLVPSTVYDGRRLPKMYRVQSVDEGFARTVAYLMPNEKLELDAKLGRVVGIVGDTSLDPALRVNIIRPRRVDVLNPLRTGEQPASGGDRVQAPAGTAADPR